MKNALKTLNESTLDGRTIFMKEVSKVLFNLAKDTEFH